MKNILILKIRVRKVPDTNLKYVKLGNISCIFSVIFVSARKRYVMKEPEGNVVIDFVKCISVSESFYFKFLVFGA